MNDDDEKKADDAVGKSAMVGTMLVLLFAVTILIIPLST